MVLPVRAEFHREAGIKFLVAQVTVDSTGKTLRLHYPWRISGATRDSARGIFKSYHRGATQNGCLVINNGQFWGVRRFHAIKALAAACFHWKATRAEVGPICCQSGECALNDRG